MEKQELLKLSLQQVTKKYEKEYRELTDKEKALFLEGFNYACLLLSK